MPQHLIKLCVGPGTLSELAAWQAHRLEEKRRAGEVPELSHVTRHMPKRGSEIIPGGSLYWVIKGWILARQALLDLRRVEKHGVPHCALIFDPSLVMVEPRPRRPFQGWRYLSDTDAPPDMGLWTHDADGSLSLQRELVSLGLL